MLKMVLGDGCAEFNLPRSPTERVRSFPVRHSPDDDPNLLSPEELGKVLAAFRSTEPNDYPLGQWKGHVSTTKTGVGLISS